MTAPKKVAVEFTKNNGRYAAGEIAGFSPEVAERLIKHGVAKKYEAEGEEKAKRGRPAKRNSVISAPVTRDVD